MTNQDEKQYLNLLQKILNEGGLKQDRTGVGTKSLFGTHLSFSLQNNTLPLLTTKKMYTKGILAELLFFLRGETNTKKLEEQGVNIWKGNTSREFLDKIGLNHEPEGSLGKGYGFQWRNWGGTTDTKGIDQISNLINTLKNNPNDRRMMVSAWNVSQLSEMALPPCHYTFQCYVEDGKLSLMWHQRSVDSFLGLPFNIASYGMLAHILAKTCNLQADRLIFTGGDTHIYLNHQEQVKTQINREPFNFPKLKINKSLSSIENIEELELHDFELLEYHSHPGIKAEMAI
jgi:thymidylate synthase